MSTLTPLMPARSNLGLSIASMTAALRYSPGATVRPSRSERASAAALVLLLHGAAVAIVMLSRSSTPVAATPGLVAFAAANADAAPAPAHPARPHHRRTVVAVPVTPVAIVPIVVPDPAQNLPNITPISDVLAQDMPAAIGGGCDLTPAVQDALRHSDDVARQLPAIPAQQRSVANAIVVWNAGWIEPAPGPAQAAFAVLRRTIAATVAAASADCRSQVQMGPRLVFLPGANKTTVLALGSGQWSWQQLIDGAPLPVGSENTMAIAPQAPFAAAPPGITTPGRPSDQTPALDALLASLVRQRPATALPYYP